MSFRQFFAFDSTAIRLFSEALKSVFAKYPTGDPEVPASCAAYDEMAETLTKKAETLLQKRDELPF